MNWAVAGWYTDNRGFLLTDALISVFVVSVLASVTAAALLSHYKASEAIQNEILQQEEKDEQALSEIEECEICEESPEPSETPEE